MRNGINGRCCLYDNGYVQCTLSNIIQFDKYTRWLIRSEFLREMDAVSINDTEKIITDSEVLEEITPP